MGGPSPSVSGLVTDTTLTTETSAFGSSGLESSDVYLSPGELSHVTETSVSGEDRYRSPGEVSFADGSQQSGRSPDEIRAISEEPSQDDSELTSPSPWSTPAELSM